MMCLLPLPYIARANTVPVAKKNATIDDRLALLVIGLLRVFFIGDGSNLKQKMIKCGSHENDIFENCEM